MKGREVGKTARARSLRKSMTPQEALLWLHLRILRSHGYRFRRQAPFRGYFLDFVCFNCRLVVEVDGGGHYQDTQLAHDQVRDAVLKREGFHTLRISNGDINTNFSGAMEAIFAALASSSPVRPPLAP